MTIAAINKPTIANTLEPSIKYHNDHIDNNQLGFYKHVSSHKDLQHASAKAARFTKIPTGKMPLS